MATGRITVVNDTADGDKLNIAIYQKPAPTSQWPVVAWRVTMPPIGVPVYVPTADNYAVFVKYKLNGVSYATPPIAVVNLMGTYRVSMGALTIEMNKVSAGSQSNTVEIDVLPQVGEGVEANITLDGHLAFPAQNVLPGSTMLYLISNAFYAAIVNDSVNMGDVLDHSVVAPTEVAVAPGQTVYITGSAGSGYTLTVKDV